MDRRLKYMLDSTPSSVQYRCEIFQYSLRLHFDGSIQFFSSVRIYRKLTGNVDQSIMYDSLCIVSARFGGGWCFDFFHFSLSILYKFSEWARRLTHLACSRLSSRRVRWKIDPPLF
jgi:hypothetical protein